MYIVAEPVPTLASKMIETISTSAWFNVDRYESSELNLEKKKKAKEAFRIPTFCYNILQYIQ